MSDTPTTSPNYGSLSPDRNVDTIPYRVVADDLPDLPKGLVFKFWEWGPVLGRADIPQVILKVADVREWEGAGKIERVRRAGTEEKR